MYTIIGMSSPDALGRVNYREFAGKCQGLIDDLFSMKSVSAKAELVESKQFETADNLGDIEFTNLELHELFKNYDRNQNGFLEIHEYIECLKKSGISLTEPEIVTLSLFADIHGNERIDYEEFTKHFQDCLQMVRFQSTLHSFYNDYQKQFQAA